MANPNLGQDLKSMVTSLEQLQGQLSNTSSSYKTLEQTLIALKQLIGGRNALELQTLIDQSVELEKDMSKVLDVCKDLETKVKGTGTALEDNVSIIDIQYSTISKILTKHKAINEELEKENESWLAIKELSQKAFNVLEKGVHTWRELDAMASKHGRTIGLNGDEIDGYRRHLIDAYTELATKYGMTNRELFALQEGYTKATSKATILTKEATEALAAATKFIGQANIDAINEAISNLGGSAMGAASASAKLIARARNTGLDANKAAQNLTAALSASQKYTFKGGVDGMTKMVMKAQSLKMSMQSIEQAAEKFTSIESSIETAARVQMLGGSMGMAFGNPLEAMSLALTDFEGFGDKLIDSISGLARFDKEKGLVDMAPVDKMRLQEFAKAMGMDYKEAYGAVSQKVIKGDVEKALRAGGTYNNLSEDERSWIFNNAQWDKEKNAFAVQYVNSDGNMETKEITRLTKESINAIKRRQTPEKQIADDVGAIRRMQEDAHDTLSFDEQLAGMEQSRNNAMAWLTGKVLNPLKDAALWAGKSLVGAMGFLGGGALMGMGYTHFKSKILNSIGGLGKGGGGTPTLGGGGKVPPSQYKYSNNGYTTTISSNVNQPNTSQQQGGGEKTPKARGPKQGRFRNTRAAFKKTFRKMPKAKGKAGLVIGGLALAGLAASYFSSRSSKEENGISDATLSNEMVDGNSELQKHTQLLTVIADKMGASAENLEAINAGMQIQLESQQAQAEENVSTMGALGQIAGGMASSYVTETAKLNAGAAAVTFGANVYDSGLANASKMAVNQVGQKGLTRTIGGALLKTPKGVGTGMLVNLGSAGVNMIGQGLGAWEEGSNTDKLLNVLSKAGEYASYGNMIGSALAPFTAGLSSGVGAAIGGAIGAVVGAVEQYQDDINEWMGVSEDVAQLRQKRYDKVSQTEFENTKIGYTGIEDPQLEKKAALATIKIQSLLVEEFGKYKDNDAEDWEEAKADALEGHWWDGFTALGNKVLDIFGFADGGIVPKPSHPLHFPNGDDTLASLKSGETVLTSRERENINSSVEALGAQATLNNTVTNIAKDINCDISGTIRLVGDGSSATIDTKELLRNTQFKNQLMTMILDEMNIKNQQGGGRNMNSRWGVANNQATAASIR